MKFVRFVLPGILFLVIAVSSYPVVQAEGNTGNVTLKANIVAPPSVITSRHIGIGARRATFNGILTSLGTASSVKVSFGWDTESHAENADAYENWTRREIMKSEGTFKANVDDLIPATTYYFRARAEGDVTNYGSEASFTTKPSRPWWDWLAWFFTW